MEYPSAALVRLMHLFVPQVHARYFPILIPDREPLSIAHLLDGLDILFAPHFGAARMTASMAVPVEYLASLSAEAPLLELWG